MQGEAKEEVRSRLNIEDVIGEYVPLKRAGRNFKGLSPFSQEKTPSFFVSPEKQIWHDFSSNRGGDVFSFVMEAEGMDFRQALEHLARKAGVDLSIYQSAQGADIARRKQRLLEAHRLAARYYQSCLVRNKGAVDYVFGQRGLDKATVQAFEIGYAPDTGSALTDALSKKDFTKKELADAGLVNRYGTDLFRGRMTVPLMDASGQVIGFTGRIIGEVENAPKYLNTPQTLLYDKSRHVFGLSQAKEGIRSLGYVVVVEGNLDVVSSHQAGVTQVVATAGTAMTEHHLRAFKRLTPDIRLCFDADKAGIAATERAIGIASSLEISLRIITLPGEAKDPDELIQQDVSLWQQAIDQPMPAVDWVIDQYAAREDLATARGKRQFTTAALALVARLSDDVERDHYESLVAERIGASREAIRSKADQLGREPEAPKRTMQSSETPAPDMATAYQDDLLALLALDAATRELIGELDVQLLASDERRQFGSYLKSHRGGALETTPEVLHEIDTYVKIVLLRADTRYADWNDTDRYYETARLVRQVEHEHKKQTRDQLIEELRDAEAAGDDSTADRLRGQLNQLIKEIARARR